MVHAAGCAEPGKKSVGGATWARHDTRNVRLYLSASVVRSSRIYAVVQKRGRGGGHVPQGRLGGQLVIRSRLGGARHCRLRGKIVGDPVPPDEARTVQDEPERHEVVRLLFECLSGERRPDVFRFSSNRVTIRPQRPVREVLVQASVRGIHAASLARSRFP